VAESGLALAQRFFLCTDGDLGITICRFQAHVTEPCPNDVDVDTGFQQVYGGRVAERMWRDVGSTGCVPFVVEIGFWRSLRAIG
jgi:hypothetical protein